MKIPIISWLLKKFIGLIRGLLGTKQEIKRLQDIQIAKAVIHFKNSGAMIIDGIISADGLFFIPAGLQRKYRISGESLLYPQMVRFYTILDEGIETIDLKKIPKTINRKKIEKDFYVTDKGEIKETIEVKEYAIKGGEELSSFAFLIGKLSPLSYMSERSQKEILMIVLLCIFAGMIIGGCGVLIMM